MVKIVEIVTITNLIPVFKEGAEANAIQVAKFSFDSGGECGFNVIAQKGLYEIGSKAIYIQPDYCLSENELFSSFIAPGGDPKKSRLGKQNRIRAIKFNFSFEGSSDPIYSNGVLLPLEEAETFLFESDKNYCFYSDMPSPEAYRELDLAEELGVTKYVAVDKVDNNKSGLTKGELPDFLYATDETRIENIKEHVNLVFNDDEEISFTLKHDGSSTTIYVKSENDNLSQGICSRNKEKLIEQEMTTNYVDVDDVHLHRYSMKNDDVYIKGWINDVSGKFYTDVEVDELSLLPITVEVRDSFVDTVKKHNYLEKLKKYCIDNDVQLALRGELVGANGGSKGSGNKLNKDAQGDSKVIWFGVDDLQFGKALRLNYSSIHNLKNICSVLEFEYTKPIFVGKLDYNGIIKMGNSIFKEYKDKYDHIVEGIVIRTTKSNKLSCKYLNLEYDSKH